MSFYSVNCSIPPDQFENATAVAYNLGMTGSLEEVENGTVFYEFFFSSKADAQKMASILQDEYRVSNCTIKCTEKQDWNAKWRQSMQPALLTQGFWVSPPWLAPPEKRAAWIKIEPKMAFGTGHHETTRLAASELIDSVGKLGNRRLLDIGTGSGVLCFVAQHCGCSWALGVEIDEECRGNLAENKELNRGAANVDFLIGTLEGIQDDVCFDFVVMNMLFVESVPLLDRVVKLMSRRAELVWSGILLTERDQIIEHALKAGLIIAGEREENEWWCGRFCRNTP